MGNEVNDMLNVRIYNLGPIQTNCYIVSNKNKECLIFDPGEEGARIINELRKNGLNPLAILLTHTHFDHIGAVDIVRELYNIPLYVHEKEVKWLADPMKNGSGKYGELPNYEVKAPEEEHIIRKEGLMTIGDFTFDVVHTPGHSPGSISFIFKEDVFLFNRNIDEDYKFMRAGYEAGILSEGRLEEAVKRILAMKAAMKLPEKKQAGNTIVNVGKIP